MGGVVVEDHMDQLSPHVGLVALMKRATRFEHVQRGEQRGRAVPLVVMRHRARAVGARSTDRTKPR